MIRQGFWEGRCPSGGEPSAMASIQSTDIMLGRGPKCYNNAGNFMLRKMIKENVKYYRNHAHRSEKAALVRLLVSKLKAKGCRFLCQSASGVWVEASTQVAEKKVGHGLRDARNDAAKIRPKNLRPAIAEHTDADHVNPAVTGEAKNPEKNHHKTSDYTALSSGRDDRQFNGYTTEVRKSDKHLIREWEQQLLDEDGPLLSNESIDVASVLPEYPVLDGGREKKGLSFLDCEVEGDFKHRDAGCAFNRTTEPHHARFASLFNDVIEERLNPYEQSGDDLINTPAPAVAPLRAGATRGVHAVVDAVDMALDMYSDYSFGYEESSVDTVDDPYERFGCAVDDAQSLCRWFSSSRSRES